MTTAIWMTCAKRAWCIDMHVFVSGGAKNGKSSFAQAWAVRTAEEKGLPLYYVATMRVHDREDAARVRRHVEDRKGLGFTTLEQGEEISSLPLRYGAQAVYLVDSVTALLANVMFPEKSSQDPAWRPEAAGRLVADDLIAFGRRTDYAIFVSDYLYSDARRFDPMTSAYIRSLSLCDRKLAAFCDSVYEVRTGIPLLWKGGPA